MYHTFHTSVLCPTFCSAVPPPPLTATFMCIFYFLPKNLQAITAQMQELRAYGRSTET